MTCPVCGGKNKVVSTRSDTETIYRERRCNDCGHVFYTKETESCTKQEFRKNASEYEKRIKYYAYRRKH